MANVFKFFVVSMVLLVPAQSNAMLSGVARRVAVQAGAASSAPRELKHYLASQFGKDETEEKRQLLAEKTLNVPSFGYPDRDCTVHSAASLELIKARIAGMEHSCQYNLNKAASCGRLKMVCAVGTLAVPTATFLHIFSAPLPLPHEVPLAEMFAGILVAPLACLNLSFYFCEEGLKFQAKAHADATYAAYLKAACTQKEQQRDAYLAISRK